MYAIKQQVVNSTKYPKAISLPLKSLELMLVRRLLLIRY